MAGLEVEASERQALLGGGFYFISKETMGKKRIVKFKMTVRGAA